MSKTLTIFTPTFNRKGLLKVLYDSLCNQTIKDFEWMIVDDGSDDGTREVVEQWINENKIGIRYFYQENAGKMKAHNRGVKNTDTPLFLCIDSDDYMVEEGVEKILKCWESDKGGDHIAGIVAHRGIDAHNLHFGTFPVVGHSTLRNLYQQGFKGDTLLIFRTEIIKKYLFPEIDGEKFIKEVYVYNQIDQDYKLIVFPEILIISEYFPDGYTRNPEKLMKENPLGHALYHAQMIQLESSFRKKIRHVINYISYSLAGKKRRIIKTSPKPFLTMLLWPVGYWIYMKREKRYKTKNG